MKTHILFALFTVLLLPLHAQDAARLTVIGPDYALSTDSPLCFTSGDTLLIRCDSVYVINTERYRIYTACLRALREDNEQPCGRLLQAYEDRLREHDESYRLLLANCRETEKVSDEMLSYTRASLENTLATLDHTQQTLDRSLEGLRQTEELLRRQQNRQTGQKFLIGAGGVGLGILVGILVGQRMVP